MEVNNLNQYTKINENEEKYMKNRKTLIIERMNIIKKFEKLYKFEYKIPKKKITFETNNNENIQSSKNLIQPFIKNKNKFLNNSQRKFFSKKDLITPILIDNINSNNIKFDKINLVNSENTNQKNNEVKNPNQTNFENFNKSDLENQNITNSNFENTNINLTNFESTNLNMTNLNNNNSSNLNNKTTKNQYQRNSMSLFSSPMTLSINRRTTQRNSEVFNSNLSYKLLNSPKKNLKIYKNLYSNLTSRNNIKDRNDNNIKNNNFNLTERKVLNPFEISEDDLIFEEMNKFNDNTNKKNKLNKKKKSHGKSKSNINEKSKMNQTKTTLSSHKSSLSQDNKILNNIYKYPNDYFKRIYEAKQSKKKLNLLNYQNNLLNIMNKNCSKDAYINLENTFQKIRSFSYQKVILNRKFIEKMEKKEKKIVKKINSANKECVKMLKTATNGFNFKSFSLPKVIFYNVIKKKNAHFFQVDSDESENI